jgi:hypothetical protein
MAPRKTTIADRIEEMLAAYEALNGEANALIDRYVEDVVRPPCPGIPFAAMRALEITNRAGFTLNLPEALRILRQAKS